MDGKVKRDVGQMQADGTKIHGAPWSAWANSTKEPVSMLHDWVNAIYHTALSCRDWSTFLLVCMVIHQLAGHNTTTSCCSITYHGNASQPEYIKQLKSWQINAKFSSQKYSENHSGWSAVLISLLKPLTRNAIMIYVGTPIFATAASFQIHFGL